MSYHCPICRPKRRSKRLLYSAVEIMDFNIKLNEAMESDPISILSSIKGKTTHDLAKALLALPPRDMGLEDRTEVWSDNLGPSDEDVIQVGIHTA